MEWLEAWLEKKLIISFISEELVIIELVKTPEEKHVCVVRNKTGTQNVGNFSMIYADVDMSRRAKSGVVIMWIRSSQNDWKVILP